MSADVLQENVLQVRFQAISFPEQGLFKVMTVHEVDEYFVGPKWEYRGATSLFVGSNTMSNNAFQILTHHWVRSDGTLEAWYVTIRPAF